MLNNIIDRLNQRIAAGNIFDKIYGLSELVESDSGKKWATYIGNGQLQHVTGFDAQQGTLFWGKRGRFNINRVDSFRTAGCQVAYDTRMLLTAYAVVRKSHLPCDSSDAADWVASRIYKLISGFDPQFKTALKVVAYEVIPSGYTSDIRSLPDNFEYAKVAVDIDVSVITQSSDACYDICETGDVPLPDFEPCTPCLTEVAVDGVTITGNGTPDDPLVALGGGGGGSLRIQDEGTTVSNAATTINFTGDGVTASLTNPGVVEVNIPASGGGGIESVTGNLVDNTDPLNPVVDAAVSSDAGNDLTLGSDGLPYYQDSGGAVDSVNGQTGVVVLDTDDIPDTATNRYTNDTDIARLANTSGTNTGDQDLSGLVPYTGATGDVDLGAHKLAAQAVNVTGVNGNGFIHLRHQASDAAATGQTTSVFADSNGNIKLKNDGLDYATFATNGITDDRTYTFPDKSGTVAMTSDVQVYTAGSGISINSNVIANTAPDQTVVLNAGTGIQVSGTYPNFTIANTLGKVFKSNQDGTVSTSTSLVASSVQLIPANWAMIDNTVRITGFFRMTGTANVKTARLYVNTTPNLSGSPVLIGTYTSTSTAASLSMERHPRIKSSILTEVFPVASSVQSDIIQGGAMASLNIDWTQTLYIIFAVQCASGADTMICSGFMIEQI